VAAAALLSSSCPFSVEALSASPNSGANNAMAPDIKVVPSTKLHVSEPDPSWFGNGPNPDGDPAWTNGNWLKSRFHFSFAEYTNPNNNDFGVLRVMNDDLVQPHRGFGTHPHRDMEIITYVVSGSLTHKDSMGTEESLGRGSIQFMTAGRGVRHSEFNHGDVPLRFIQTWIKPSGFGLTPNYGSCSGSADKRRNKLHHLVSNVKDDSVSTPVEINQDVNAFASELELGKSVTLNLPPNQMAYLLCIEGSVRLNGEKVLKKHDGAEITGEGGPVKIEAVEVEEVEGNQVAHVLSFTMPSIRGAGRTDL